MRTPAACPCSAGAGASVRDVALREALAEHQLEARRLGRASDIAVAPLHHDPPVDVGDDTLGLLVRPALRACKAHEVDTCEPARQLVTPPYMLEGYRVACGYPHESRDRHAA